LPSQHQAYVFLKTTNQAPLCVTNQAPKYPGNSDSQALGKIGNNKPKLDENPLNLAPATACSNGLHFLFWSLLPLVYPNGDYAGKPHVQHRPGFGLVSQISQAKSWRKHKSSSEPPQTETAETSSYKSP